jgi:hypothetical protein
LLTEELLEESSKMKSSSILLASLALLAILHLAEQKPTLRSGRKRKRTRTPPPVRDPSLQHCIAYVLDFPSPLHLTRDRGASAPDWSTDQNKLDQYLAGYSPPLRRMVKATDEEWEAFATDQMIKFLKFHDVLSICVPIGQNPGGVRKHGDEWETLYR